MKKLQESLLDNEEELLDNTDVLKNIKYLEKYNNTHPNRNKIPLNGCDAYHRQLNIGDLVITDTFTVGVIRGFDEGKAACYVSLNEKGYTKGTGFGYLCRRCIKIADTNAFAKVIK